jgi:hypothetical protein
VFLILAKLSGQFLKAQVEKALGENVKAGAVSISWGKVTVEDLTFLRDGETVGQIKSVNIKADFMSVLKKRLSISKVEVNEPYFKLLIDNKGKLILPVAIPEEKKEQGKEKEKQKESEAKESMPVEVKALVVKNGKIDFEDRSTARPVLLKFEDLRVDVKDVEYPFANKWTSYEVSSQLTGGSRQGSINAAGKTNLMNEETKVKTELRNIDLALLRPYIEKKGEAKIERGFLNMDMDTGVVKERIKAPGVITIKDLQLSSSGGASGTFLGVPRSMVISFLKNNNNEIGVDFILEGDLNNPQFNIRENLARRFSLGLADKLGFSIKGVGEAVTGGNSKVIEGTTKTLKGLFKR